MSGDPDAVSVKARSMTGVVPTGRAVCWNRRVRRVCVYTCVCACVWCVYAFTNVQTQGHISLTWLFCESTQLSFYIIQYFPSMQMRCLSSNSPPLLHSITL